MAIALTCLSCAADLKVRDALAGRQVKCPKCGERLIVSAGDKEGNQTNRTGRYRDDVEDTDSRRERVRQSSRKRRRLSHNGGGPSMQDLEFVLKAFLIGIVPGVVWAHLMWFAQWREMKLPMESAVWCGAAFGLLFGAAMAFRQFKESNHKPFLGLILVGGGGLMALTLAVSAMAQSAGEPAQKNGPNFVVFGKDADPGKNVPNVIVFGKDANPVPPKTNLPPARITGDTAIDQLLADLKAVDLYKRINAAVRLRQMQPNQHRAVVAEHLAVLAEDTNQVVRRETMRALGLWGTPKEVPVFIKALDDSDIPTRQEALKVIAGFKDARSVPGVVRCFQEGRTRQLGEKALREMGSMVEPDLLPVLNATDNLLRWTTIKILKEIGTRQSLPALEAILAGGRNTDKRFARDAIAAILARTEK